MIKRLRIGAVVVVVFLVILALRHLSVQQISSVADLQCYMSRFGHGAPAVLTLIQALQVVFPILPGFMGCVAGALSLGVVRGFLCNYIGISAGSIIAFFLGRTYGEPLVRTMFSETTYRVWSERCSKKKSYHLFLFIATLLPLFPDDFLCYFSGLVKMNTKRFIAIILLGKPWCILAYSIVFGML